MTLGAVPALALVQTPAFAPPPQVAEQLEWDISMDTGFRFGGHSLVLGAFDHVVVLWLLGGVKPRLHWVLAFQLPERRNRVGAGPRRRRWPLSRCVEIQEHHVGSLSQMTGGWQRMLADRKRLADC